MKSHWIVITIIIFLMVQVLLPQGLEAGIPEPGNAPNATYITGDWVIVDSVNRTNETIVLTGNLIVPNNCNLSFENVTLQMNCSFDGQYYIEVQPGGSFYVNDTDKDDSTVSDASLVTGGLVPGFGYHFRILADAVFEIRNSAIENCGLLTGIGGADESGLKLASDLSLLDGTNISGCANGIIINSCNATVKNCSVTNNLFNGI